MVGAFGLLDDRHHTRFPPDRLIENRACLDVFWLNRIGAFTEGTITELRWGKKPYQLARQTPDILVNGNRVPIAWDVQGRPWFVCPGCGQHRQHLYLDELLCRRCAGLDYISRHLHRSTPGVHQVVRLRRKIGADQRPFAPLPERPEHHVRFHRIVARIRNEEAGLVEHLGSIVHDLDRRIRVRKAKGKW